MAKAAPKLFSVNIEDQSSNRTYKISVTASELARLGADPNFVNEKLVEARNLEFAQEIGAENREPVEVIYLGMDLDEPVEDPVVAIPEDRPAEESAFKWPHEAILLLIEEYRSNESGFLCGKLSKRKLWEKISEQLNVRGYKITGPQCYSKFTGMKRTFKNIKDHNNKSGNSAKTWPYFVIMDSLLGDRPNVAPVATCSSSGKRTRTISECSSASSSTTTSGELDDKSNATNRSKAVAPIDKLLGALEERSHIQEANRERRFREFMELKERKMEESNAIKRKATDLLESVLKSKEKF